VDADGVDTGAAVEHVAAAKARQRVVAAVAAQVIGTVAVLAAARSEVDDHGRNAP
jgi:hypothetical protein